MSDDDEVRLKLEATMPDGFKRGFDLAILSAGAVTASVDELTQLVLEWAAETFRADRALATHFVMHATLPLPAIIVARPRTNDPNFADYKASSWVHRGVRELAKVYAARAIFTASEVWISRNDAYSGARGSQPRLDPDRREAAFVLVENPRARPPMQAWEALIERNKGRPRLREWVRLEEYKVKTGRLTFLLPREAYGAVGDA